LASFPGHKPIKAMSSHFRLERLLRQPDTQEAPGKRRRAF
jgi:hypothetical protein